MMKASKLKANELRIGNLVNTKYGIKVVTDINVNQYCFFLEDHVTPIKLSEKWMLELGFEDGEEGHYYINKFIINIYGEVYWGDSEEWLGELQYVHQLQNLYFALTGEELTIGGQDESNT